MNWDVLLNYGVGGAVAAVCLYLLFQEIRRNATERKEQSEEYAADLKAQADASAKVLEAHIRTLDAHIARLELRDQSSLAVIQANTAALIGLHEAVGKLSQYTEIVSRLQNMEDRLKDGYPATGDRRQQR